MSEFCRGRTNETACDCEEFTPLDDMPAKCVECSHGKSKHPKGVGSESIAQTRPTNTQPQSLTSQQSVLQLFQGITSAHGGSKPAAFEQARVESVRGFGS
jgi:hypothetical protein